jgi:hypothetical protein
MPTVSTRIGAAALIAAALGAPANFQSELNDEQIGRFNALEIAATH